MTDCSPADRDALADLICRHVHGSTLDYYGAADAILADYSRSSGGPREWRTDPTVQEARQAHLKSITDWYVDPYKLRGKNPVMPSLDVLCEAVASSGAPAPTDYKREMTKGDARILLEVAEIMRRECDTTRGRAKSGITLLENLADSLRGGA